MRAHLLALALLVAPSAAFFDQIFEQLHAQQGGGGGGGHTFEFNMGGGGGGGQAMEAKWPKGVSKKITKKYSWLKATTWDWNGNHVKFEADGSFKAQDRQCQMGLCKWSANKGVVNINTPKTQRTAEKVLKFSVQGELSCGSRGFPPAASRLLM